MVWSAYRRVASKGACSFCLMLASRGAVYTSAEAAVAGHKVDVSGHDHCHCSAELETDPSAKDLVRIDPADANKIIRSWTKRGKTAKYDLSRFDLVAPPKPVPVAKVAAAKAEPRAIREAMKRADVDRWLAETTGDDLQSEYIRRALQMRFENLRSQVWVETGADDSIRGAIGIVYREEAQAMFVETLGSQGGGAGTRLLQRVAALARHGDRGLQLEPTADSLPFYKRLGMVLDPEGTGSPFYGIARADIPEFIKTGRVARAGAGEVKAKARFSASNNPAGKVDLPISNRTMQWQLDTIDQYLEDLGIKPGQLADAYRRRFADRIRRTPARIAAPDNLVKGILRDGRYRTSHEVRHGIGIRGQSFEQYMSRRRAFEDDMLGLGDDLPGNDRPVYGFLDDDVEFMLQAGYGEAEIVLTEGAKSRATFTLGDSLHGHLRPMGIDQMDNASDMDWFFSNQSRAWIERNADAIRRGEDVADDPFSDYLEIQVHGGVDLSDIKEIVFRTEPDETTKKLLAKRNVKWRMAEAEWKKPGPVPTNPEALAKAVKATKMGQQRVKSKAKTTRGKLQATHDALGYFRVAQAHYRESGIDEPDYLAEWIKDLEQRAKDLLAEGA